MPAAWGMPCTPGACRGCRGCRMPGMPWGMPWMPGIPDAGHAVHRHALPGRASACPAGPCPCRAVHASACPAGPCMHLVVTSLSCVSLRLACFFTYLLHLLYVLGGGYAFSILSRFFCTYFTSGRGVILHLHPKYFRDGFSRQILYFRVGTSTIESSEKITKMEKIQRWMVCYLSDTETANKYNDQKNRHQIQPCIKYTTTHLRGRGHAYSYTTTATHQHPSSPLVQQGTHTQPTKHSTKHTRQDSQKTYSYNNDTRTTTILIKNNNNHHYNDTSRQHQHHHHQDQLHQRCTTTTAPPTPQQQHHQLTHTTTPPTYSYNW